MSNPPSIFATAGWGATVLPPRFDAERDTPELLDALALQFPDIGLIMRRVRESLPLASNSRVGIDGAFWRLPNHYRSVFSVSADAATADVRGVIVFKGTEPLLPDFPEYVDWMLRSGFRGSYLPIGLHFPLEMKLPPAAMWIEESMLEQEITSRIQFEYLGHYGRLARLPVPLFVFALTAEQVDRYQTVVRSRVSAAAFSRIEAKVAGGLGVEVYYYPSLPVRAADLFVSDCAEGAGIA